MEWYWVILIMFGTLAIFILSNMPIGLAFMFPCILGAFLFWGGFTGIELLGSSMYAAVASFGLLPIPLFMLMGEIIFQSGVGVKMVETVEKMMGRVPGRLCIISTTAGVLAGSMLGVSGASIVIIAKTLYPEMARRGYNKFISLGSIVITGTLATMIPPSAGAILIGIIGNISIGKMLIAILIPGLLISVFILLYIIVLAKINPTLAPNYPVQHLSKKETLSEFTRHILPIAIIVFAVIGCVFLGIATPSEASALGVVACLIVAAIDKNLSIGMIKKSALSAIGMTGMVFFIILSSVSFGRLLSTSGSITSMVNLATSFHLSPIVLIILTQVIIFALGCFMDGVSIMMITIPIFVPLATALHYDPVWFGVICLLNIQLGGITPPFGIDVYTMKAVTPPDVTIVDVFKSSLPYMGMAYLVMVLIFIFPQIALWLPGLMVQ
jgi:tripartite ATP-independent transporter DctM subunit